MTDTTFKTFKATVDNVDIRGEMEFFGIPDSHPDYSEFDLQFRRTSGIVEFSVSFDVKEYGIRGIDVNIDRFSCSAEWYVDADDLTEADKELLKANGGIECRNGLFEGTLHIDSNLTLKGVHIDWTITNNLEFTEKGALQVGYVILDLVNRDIEVS